MTSHEADLQHKLQEARAEIIRLRALVSHVDENGEHKYTSTYCLHGRHSECRLECKICPSACLCDCGHVKVDPPATRPWRSFRNAGKLST